MEQRIEPKIGIVIVAGGSGTRIGGTKPKQFQIIGQRPILAYTIDLFSRALPTAEIVVVLAKDMIEYWQNLAARFDVAKHKTVIGGAERFDSVKCGVIALSDDVEIIGVHDGARPFCSVELVKRCLHCALSSGSAIPVVNVSDSLREVCSDGGSKAIDRSSIRAVQTPQMFDAITLRRAYNQPYKSTFTDDASLVEGIGEKVWLCDGESQNIKITTREDLILAQRILEDIDNE
ncbi:MAG: 2-C-methyl-D-erythritol 4-phosphate cytidylyltransferase [Rikenellaceae bacterium]